MPPTGSASKRLALFHTRTLTTMLCAMALAACGGDETNTTASAERGENSASSAAASREPEATLRLGGESFTFRGGRCYLSADGGSDGGISLSQFETSDGAELSLDWAGDSPQSSMASVEFPDQRRWSASSMGDAPPFDVVISGDTATVKTRFMGSGMAPGESQEGVIEVSCP